MIKDEQIPKKTGLIILAIKKVEDEKLLFNPPSDHVFSQGDVLLVLGREEQVEKLRDLATKDL